jgi:hypothetical protein
LFPDSDFAPASEIEKIHPFFNTTLAPKTLNVSWFEVETVNRQRLDNLSSAKLAEV